MKSYNIAFVSDYVCPYCIVAKESLKIALKQMQTEAKITYIPFELTREPEPRVDTYHDERRKENYKVLYPVCKALDLDVKLPPNVVPRPYSTMAFYGWYYACEMGLGDAYNDAVYEAYFIREEDIGNIDVLGAIAVRVGLDEEKFRQEVLSGNSAELLNQINAYTRDMMHVEHVPTIYVNGTELQLETYMPEEFVRLMETI